MVFNCMKSEKLYAEMVRHGNKGTTAGQQQSNSNEEFMLTLYIDNLYHVTWHIKDDVVS